MGEYFVKLSTYPLGKVARMLTSDKDKWLRKLKLKNGKGTIQLSALIRIFEEGLNRKIVVTYL